MLPVAPRVHSANLLLEILLTRARQVTLLIDHPQAIVFLCIITELSQIQGPTGWHTMLLIYRIREFSFQKNNCDLVLLTQLIKLMVDVTHTIYMSVLLDVLLKENLCFLLLLKYISLVLVLWKPHIIEYTVVLCNLILTRLSFQ